MSIIHRLSIIFTAVSVLLSCQSVGSGDERMSVRSGNLGDYGLILHHPVAVVSEGRLIVTGALKKLNPSVPVHAGQLNIAIFDPAGALLVQSVTRYHPETISPRVNRKHGAKFFVVFESLPPDLAMGSVQVSFLNEQVPDH